MNSYPINLVNESELTNWIKEITWVPTDAPITYANIKDREFVKNNAEPVARMMVHSYIKKNIKKYIAGLGDVPYITPVDENTDISEAVQACVDAGNRAVVFNPDKADELKQQITKLNTMLFDKALEYMKGQVNNNQQDFDLDLRYLDNSFTDINQAFTKAKWHAKMPPVPQKPDLQTFIPHGKEFD